MRSRHSVLGGGIAGLTLFGNNLSLASYTALQLGLDFLTASLLEWISATTDERESGERAENG